jgi:hypothetical protein
MLATHLSKEEHLLGVASVVDLHPARTNIMTKISRFLIILNYT